EFAVARECFRECVALCRQAGEARGLAWSLFQLAFASYQVGDLDAARQAPDESLDACHRAERERPGTWLPLEPLALVAAELGDFVLANRLLDECLADPQLSTDRRRLGLVLDGMASLAA